MQEIYENGPVVATFAVYKDFHSYTHGVYVKVDDTLMGYHAVRIIGWGEDKASGQPYWLIANSWNETCHAVFDLLDPLPLKIIKFISLTRPPSPRQHVYLINAPLQIDTLFGAIH